MTLTDKQKLDAIEALIDNWNNSEQEPTQKEMIGNLLDVQNKISDILEMDLKYDRNR